ncbi:MAG: MMPL family transporter [Propionibacterium sp.]|nr:MMPL family transporter [Propionibacterium sp.]
MLIAWLLAAAILGGIGVAIQGRFNDSFEIPGSSSQEALQRLNMTFPQGSALTANAVIVAPEGHDINDLQAEIEPVLDRFLDSPIVDDVQSPWFEYVSGQVSDDNRAALATITLNVAESPNPEQLQTIVDAGEHVEAALPAGSDVVMGGPAFEIELPALTVTEVFGVVLSFIVLIVMLGSVLAAVVPIVTALLGVGLAMALMLGATSIMEINSVTPILAVMLGLAVGIDYALFIFARHRDQLRAGMDAEESMGLSIGTAGTAVVFAGATNAIALTGLAVARIPFMTVMGIFASIAVAFAVAIALTLLPAFGGMLGERMRPKPRKEKAQAEGKAPRKGLFRWWVGVTTSRPIATIVAVVVVLGTLTIPAANLTLSLPNAGQGAEDRSSRIAYDLTAEHFGPGYNAPLVITAGIIGSDDPLGLVDELVDEVEAVEGVDRVVMAVPNQNADTALIQLVPTTGSDDPATVDTVETLRDITDGWAESRGIQADVTGFTAVQLDVTQRLGEAIIPFGLLVVGLSLVLLAAVFRSVWVPVKTAVGFLLSVGASFGITQLVFNEGWFKEIINLEKPEAIISFLPILLMGILFGLAMDYEIFIVSRIREDYMHGKPAMQSIRDGFVASGPVVTAAALVMVAVFAFFVPAGMMAIKQIAFALAIGVLIDAFLIRMTLVPAVLALLGDHAWWMPKWLDKLLPKFDMEGEQLTKQLELADWPGTDAMLHAEEITVDGILEPLSVQARGGQVVGIVGTVGARAGAALALSGRLETASGRGRVCGALLPDDAGTIRRRTYYVDLSAERDPAASLDRLKPRPRTVVFIDGIDGMGTPAGRTALQRVVEHARETEDIAVICCASSEAALTAVQPDDVVHVTEPAHEEALV